ncbi:MAG: hypothetical protein IK023_02120 [Bacteroidaceae bacterium]|nr:hypothetical protein [Bacteroidaceae bacterium]
MMKNLFTLLSLLMTGLMITSSCSNDDDYTATLPIYSDVVFTLNGEQLAAGNIPAGSKVNVTLVQDRKGTNIYRYEYSWSCEGVTELSPVKSSNTNADPTNSFVAPTPGQYTMTINVTYNYSGNGGPTLTDGYAISGGSVTYSAAGALYGKATITKNFTVR